MTTKPLRILNVEDDEVQRSTTSRILAAAGFEVIEARTAKEALALATSNLDLIVMDVDLPDIDGFQLTRTLKGQAATAKIPIVQLSAVFSGYAHVRDGLRNGADAYFTFPLESESFISAIRNLTKRGPTTKNRARGFRL